MSTAVNAHPVEYSDGEITSRTQYFTPEDAEGPLPVVLVCPAWDGIVEEVFDKSYVLSFASYHLNIT